MKVWILAWRSFSYDWRSVELRILALALTVAVTALSSVNFFTDRIRKVITQQAAELLGGDLRISAPEPLPKAFFERAQNDQLYTTSTLTFRSMALHHEDTLLTEVKAVQEGYPLYGQLWVTEAGKEVPTKEIPAPGKIWVEAQLLTQLNMHVGEALNLGEMTLTIDRVISYEPDRGGLFFQLAPRILMNFKDIEKTQLLSAGSRVTYKLLAKGEKLPFYRAWLEKNLQPGQKIEGLKDSQPELRLTLERVEQFLGLAALLSVLLGGVAIAVASQYFSRKQADVSAILRCLGATQKLILQLYILRILGLGILASGLGCVLGWLAQQGLAYLLAHYLLLLHLPLPSWKPWGIGMATGLITLLGFALPPLLHIHQVPLLWVLRHDQGVMPPSGWQVVAFASFALSALLGWQIGDFSLMLYLGGGIAITVVLLMAMAWGAIASLRFFYTPWQFGLANLIRRAQSSRLQLASLSMGIMALLLLAIVRVNLFTTWQNTLPPGTPNHFIVNIFPQEAQAVQEKLTALLAPQSFTLYPMIRGQLITINGQTISASHYTDTRTQRLVERTFNLSYVKTLPEDNRLVAGRFWTLHDQKQFSVEQELAQKIGIKLGDSLCFQVATQKVCATVTSLRSVQWDSFHANFFILASPDVLQNLPTTYLTSVYLPHSTDSSLSQLVRAFPNITVINITALMSRARHLMDQAVLAIEYVFGLTLLSGLLILYITIIASREERLYEGAILRILGATQRQLLMSIISEFMTIGLLAGGLAALAANSLGYLLAKNVLNLSYHIDLEVWIIGLVGSALGITLAGILGTRSVLQHPPLEILRRVM